MRLKDLNVELKPTPNGDVAAIIPTDHPHYREIARLEDYELFCASGPPDRCNFLFRPIVKAEQLVGPEGVEEDVK